MEAPTCKCAVEPDHLRSSQGKAYLVYILTMKLEQWQKLPWLLCVLGHLSEDVARAGAKHILAQ